MKALRTRRCCMSVHAVAASAATLDNSTAADYPSYLGFDDFDDLGETTAQSTTRVPGLVIAPVIEPDTLVVDQDGFDYNMADTVPVSRRSNRAMKTRPEAVDFWDF